MGWLGDFGASIAGGIVDSAFGRSNAKYAAGLQYNNWVKQMSNAHQLEVSDLRKAGLNPILSATNSQMAGIGSAPSITTGNTADNLTSASIARMQNKTALKGLEIEDKKAETERLNAATNLKNAETQERLAASQGFVNNALVDYYSAGTAYQYSQRDKVVEEINAIKAKLPYEIDKLVADTGAAHAAARLSLASVNLVAAQADLTVEQKNQIVSDLNDPKKLASKEFWTRVLNPKTKADQVIHDSFMRGLENDIVFSFYGDSNKEIPVDVEKIATVLARGKYITKK